MGAVWATKITKNAKVAAVFCFHPSKAEISHGNNKSDSIPALQVSL
jgi:hypothetical protein